VQAVAAEALTDLIDLKLANEPYMAYLKRKLGEWYHEAPRPALTQALATSGRHRRTCASGFGH
jgi:hypothetical protein